METFIMLKVIIVDDEQLIIEGLKKTINHMMLDVEIVGEAMNALDAIELVKTKKPDIILTDIIMPDRNGLELIETIRELQSEVYVIIISGYNDFQYAKRALVNNVQDYLLKPIDPEELLETLGKIIDRHKLKKRKQISEYQLNKIEYFKRRINLENRLAEDNSEYGIEMNYYVVAAAYLYEIFEKIQGKLQIQTVIDYIYDYKLESMDITVFENKIGELICIFEGAKLEDQNILECLQMSCEMAKKELGCHISFGVSRMEKDPSAIRECYHEAVHNLDIRIYRARGYVYSAMDIQQYQSISRLYRMQYSRELVESISLLHQQRLLSAVDEIFNDIEAHRYNPSEVLVYLSEILLSIRQELKKSGNEDILHLIDAYIRRYDVIRKYHYMKDIKSFFKTRLIEIMNAIDARNGNNSIRIIEKVKQYIRNHYKEELNLKSVSEAFQMNSSYLSYLFKKETGMNYVDYVISVKMEIAKNLLIDQPNLRIYEIANLLGYRDARYFNKNFKHIYKLSPGQYREKNKL